jgi:hypothetical protein
MPKKNKRSWIVAECVDQRRLPGWLGDALNTVRGLAGPNRLGLVVARDPDANDSSVVMMSLEDWRDWFGPLFDAGIDKEANGEREVQACDRVVGISEHTAEFAKPARPAVLDERTLSGDGQHLRKGGDCALRETHHSSRQGDL